MGYSPWGCKESGMIERLHFTQRASQVSLEVMNLPASAEDKRCRFDPWVGTIPWNRKWHPTPLFLPGEAHGQRSLAGYSPRSHKELDTTGRLTLSFSFNKLKPSIKSHN